MNGGRKIIIITTISSVLTTSAVFGLDIGNTYSFFSNSSVSSASVSTLSQNEILSVSPIYTDMSSRWVFLDDYTLGIRIFIYFDLENYLDIPLKDISFNVTNKGFRIVGDNTVKLGSKERDDFGIEAISRFRDFLSPEPITFRVNGLGKYIIKYVSIPKYTVLFFSTSNPDDAEVNSFSESKENSDGVFRLTDYDVAQILSLLATKDYDAKEVEKILYNSDLNQIEVETILLEGGYITMQVPLTGITLTAEEILFLLTNQELSSDQIRAELLSNGLTEEQIAELNNADDLSSELIEEILQGIKDNDENQQDLEESGEGTDTTTDGLDEPADNPIESGTTEETTEDGPDDNTIDDETEEDFQDEIDEGELPPDNPEQSDSSIDGNLEEYNN